VLPNPPRLTDEPDGAWVMDEEEDEDEDVADRAGELDPTPVPDRYVGLVVVER
jgi:hypothetical protein